MKKHLYNSKLSKVSWFVNRFGASEIFLKPARVLLAPIIIPFLTKKSFKFKGELLACFYHSYNMTWASERCVEIPIAGNYLSKSNDPILEIGNVLSHYGPVKHTVLDKFEKGPGVINQDILDFNPSEKYNLILSISTFEHIGYDDESTGSSAEKILLAIDHTRSLLSKEGLFVMTIPIGYNPELDELIKNSQIPAFKLYFMGRFGSTEWKEVSQQEGLAKKYKTNYPYGNAIMIAEFSAKS